jgi:spermidine synthase
VQPWLAGAQINRDRGLRLQYLAGMALNVNDEAGIYREILQYRQFPMNLFTGSRENLEALVLELHAGGR